MFWFKKEQEVVKIPTIDYEYVALETSMGIYRLPVVEESRVDYVHIESQKRTDRDKLDVWVKVTYIRNKYGCKDLGDRYIYCWDFEETDTIFQKLKVLYGIKPFQIIK
jgi:hypothetical protein